MDHTEAPISQNYNWLNLRENIWTHIKACKTFQKDTTQIKYGDSSAKETEAIPWERL